MNRKVLVLVPVVLLALLPGAMPASARPAPALLDTPAQTKVDQSDANHKQAAQNISKTGPASEGSVSNPARPYVVLYDQLGNPGTYSVVSQNFETAHDDIDSQLAGDFVVSGDSWTVNELDVAGVYFFGSPSPGGPARDFLVTIYADNGGLPGAQVVSQDNQVYFSEVPHG